MTRKLLLPPPPDAMATPTGGWGDAESLESAFVALLAADGEWLAAAASVGASSGSSGSGGASSGSGASGGAGAGGESEEDVRLADGGGGACRYRRGKCGRPRARKKSGAPHSLCELHRQRSIVNQRRFDQKRRFERLLQRAVEDEEEVGGGGEDSEWGELKMEGGGQGDCCSGEEERGRKRKETTALENTAAKRRAADECKDQRYDIGYITGSPVSL